MVDIRRRCELYVALTDMLEPELAEYLVRHLEDVERTPEYQRHNRERFEGDRGRVYKIYGALRTQLGVTHTTTLFEMLDPLGWAAGADAAPVVAEPQSGGDHGGR